jgi:hypothetical protein
MPSINALGQHPLGYKHEEMTADDAANENIIKQRLYVYFSVRILAKQPNMSEKTWNK